MFKTLSSDVGANTWFGSKDLHKVKVKSLCCVRLFVTPWTVAHQAPPSMGFSRQEYWSGLPFPSPGDLPDPGIKPRSPAFQAEVLTSCGQKTKTYNRSNKEKNSIKTLKNVYIKKIFK